MFPRSEVSTKEGGDFFDRRQRSRRLLLFPPLSQVVVYFSLCVLCTPHVERGRRDGREINDRVLAPSSTHKKTFFCRNVEDKETKMTDRLSIWSNSFLKAPTKKKKEPICLFCDITFFEQRNLFLRTMTTHQAHTQNMQRRQGRCAICLEKRLTLLATSYIPPTCKCS